MEGQDLKTSISRKTLHMLSERQKRRIKTEFMNNVRSAYLTRETIHTMSDMHVPGPSSVSEEMVVFNSLNDETCNANMIQKTDSLSPCMFDVSNDSQNEITYENASSCTNTVQESSFREQLAACFTDSNLSHVQGNSILSLLRTHSCFSSLPKDVRTLLQTPHKCLSISSVPPGEYLHFDLELGIVDSLSNASCTSVDEIVLDFNTDGCNLDKQSTIHIWPIQCRIVNVQYTPIIVTGIYKGQEKPHNPNIFFDKFVKDIQRIISNGGIQFNDKKVLVRLRCFIADALARAFILNHRNHMSKRPCSKCKISGTHFDTKYYVFNGINHSSRTDEEYLKRLDKTHYKEGTSPLSQLLIGMVTQVPFEYMHLVCIGVMKKLLLGWIKGKYSRETKLSSRAITVINERIHSLQEYCPSEFARRPRSLEICSKYKATELRQILLYIGPALFHDLLHESAYKHFLFLHTAIRILASKCPSRQHLRLAECAIQKFVLRTERLYGSTFNSYNVHGLLHLTDDVRCLGSLDSFSAFPYESNMSIFRRYCRKANQPLQQIFNRIKEKQAHGSTKVHNVETYVRVFMPYTKDTNSRRYQKIKFNNILLSIRNRDNCCILNDGSICIITDIFNDDCSYYLSVKKFLQVANLYDVGISSSDLQVYTCAALADEVSHIDVHKVCAKGYRMPYWNNTTDDSSDDSTADNDLYSPQYIVVGIMHNEVL